ncbi:hypothetical protein AKJ37_04990, partial [candidate division MSBL1 archaeon SCGC-AAA259I09]
MNRYRFPPCEKNRRTTRLFVLFAWPSLREKFREVRNAGRECDFLGYLDSLRRVLKNPFPEREKVEKYVPSG